MEKLFLNGMNVGSREGNTFNFFKVDFQARIMEIQPQVVLVFAAEFDIRHYNVWLHYIQRSKLKFCIVCFSYKYYFHSEKTNHLRTVAPLFSEDTGYRIADLGNITSIKALLYAGNLVRNWEYFYTLPRPEHLNKNIRHVHIGHGDSDKASSSVRAQKIYDFTFVADQIAIERFRNNGINLPQDHFIIIGAPIFPDINVTEHPSKITSVVYIPTFEGANSLMNYSSLGYLHETISSIIDRKNIQMLYHPHPAMGMRVKEYKQVSDGISAKLFNGPVSMSKVEIFNKSDAALCDVSGVTSEYLFSCKPIIFPCTEKTVNDIELNANFRSVCYFWDFEKLHLEDFLRSIASDPLFEARLSFRNSKFHNVKTFQECIDRFDDALDQVCR